MASERFLEISLKSMLARGKIYLGCMIEAELNQNILLPIVQINLQKLGVLVQAATKRPIFSFRIWNKKDDDN